MTNVDEINNNSINEIELTDAIEPSECLELFESDKTSVVDGINIIGRIKGEFFVPNGTSRNNRFYTKKLWENVLNDNVVIGKLKSRRIWGTIGHETPVNEISWAEGKISHILSDMYIDEKGKGIGEALILNTVAGRNLKLMLNAMSAVGSSPYVSSRATGKLENIKGKKVPVVNEKVYSFKGFDIVTDPGFLEANPQLVESLEEYDINITNEVKEEVNMSDVTEKLLTGRIAEIKEELDSALQEIISLKHAGNKKDERIKTLEEEDASVMKDMMKKKEHWEDKEKAKAFKLKEEFDKELAEEKAKIETLTSVVDEYIEIVGTVEECKTKLETVKTEQAKVLESLKEYQECGTVEAIKEMVKTSEDLKAKMRMDNLVKSAGVNEEVIASLVAAGMEDELIIKTIKDIEASKGTYEKFSDKTDENLDKDDKKGSTPAKSTGSVLESLAKSYQTDIQPKD
jgi:hypothetical protein